MALITTLAKSNGKASSKVTETEATYQIINGLEERYIQIDTYGSKNRKHPGIASQSIRMNKEIALQVKEIIERTFPE